MPDIADSPISGRSIHTAYSGRNEPRPSANLRRLTHLGQLSPFARLRADIFS